MGWRWVVLFALLVGCSSTDEVSTNSDTSCPPGSRPHPISGVCTPTSQRQNNLPDAAPPNARPNNRNNDMGQDARQPILDIGFDMDPTIVDLGQDDRCRQDQDSDGDGLNNRCECTLGTDPGNSDTDGDALPDGREDANKNCMHDGDETQATAADTDGDGAEDGRELAAGSNPLSIDTDDDGILDGPEIASGCLNPNSADTDGDGIPDAEEDSNQDGVVGTCPMGTWAVGCALGESNPCAADSDGNGTPDPDEPAYLGCRQEFKDQLVTPLLINDQSGDYQLALPTAMKEASVSGLSNGRAHVFEDAPNQVAGFVAQLPRPNGNDVNLLRDVLVSRVQGAFGQANIRSSGRRSITHDGFATVAATRLDLGVQGGVAQQRDTLLVALAGGGAANHTLAGNFAASNSNLQLLMTVVDRGAGSIIVSGALVPQTPYEDSTAKTGYLVDDAVSPMSLATFADTLEDDCVSYRVDERPAVDFLWVIDGSGSMSDENALVQSYAQSFTQILSRSNLDYRLGVVSSTCAGIADDAAISQSVKDLYGTGSGLFSPCPNPPVFGTRYKNGFLCDKNGANFTRDAQKFKDCVAEMSRGTNTLSEHTVTIAAAAIDRASPRQDNNPLKLRPNAATVVISVTDEFDDHIQGKMNWDDASGAMDPPVDPSPVDNNKLNMVVQPFLDYYQRLEVGATLFGIIWLPGQACAGSIASEAAAGIQRLAELTGGAVGDLCSGMLQQTLEQFAEASAGLASGLRLRGSPATPTIAVRIGRAMLNMIEQPGRSRSQGWDYDAVTNAVVFKGNNPPQTGDRVVIAYKRWKASVRQCVEDIDCPREQKYRCVDGTCR